jgi:hypothetical protein
MDNRVFWSVLCALLVFSGLCFFVYASTVAVQRRALVEAQSSAGVSSRSLVPSARQLPSPGLFYSYGQALPPGFVCSAAGGIVYRRVVAAGAISLEPLYERGQLVRCAGDWRSSIR